MLYTEKFECQCVDATACYTQEYSTEMCVCANGVQGAQKGLGAPLGASRCILDVTHSCGDNRGNGVPAALSFTTHISPSECPLSQLKISDLLRVPEE